MTYIVTATNIDSRIVLHVESTVLYGDGTRLHFMISGSELDDSVTSLNVTATFILVGVETSTSLSPPLMAHTSIGNRWLGF